MDFPSSDPLDIFTQAFRNVVEAYKGNQNASYLVTKNELFELTESYLNGPNFPLHEIDQGLAYSCITKLYSDFFQTAYPLENELFLKEHVYRELLDRMRLHIPEEHDSTPVEEEHLDAGGDKRGIADLLVDRHCPHEFKPAEFHVGSTYDDGYGGP